MSFNKGRPLNWSQIATFSAYWAIYHDTAESSLQLSYYFIDNSIIFYLLTKVTEINKFTKDEKHYVQSTFSSSVQVSIFVIYIVSVPRIEN